MADVPYDLGVLGVTGYTGELVLRYLNELGPKERGRVVLAGRDVCKVAARCQQVCGESWPVLRVDTGDAESLSELAKSTRTVLNLAGPYGESGPAVVAACVEAGAHYLDLTGEPLFVRDMIAQHHAAAQASRVRVVHCVGFESLPFDLAALCAVSRLRERYEEPCDLVQLSIEMIMHDPAVKRDAALSGGTTATILQLLANGTPELTDPALLLPPGPWARAARDRHAMRRKAAFDPLTESWATPVFPAPTLNPQVILRSAALYAEAGAPYGPDFRYEELSSLRGLVPRPLQRGFAIGAAAALSHGMDVLQHGPDWERSVLAKAISKVGAATGEGPRHDLLDKFDYTIRARASAASGHTAHVLYEGRGNPGYLSTAKVVVEAALALTFDSARLPPIHGVLTPAAALGLTFLPRLARAGVTLSYDKK